MTDFTSLVQATGVAAAAPTYTAITATDFFTAQPSSRYILHYKNGATPTGASAFKVTDPTTPIPAGSGLAAGFADVSLKTADFGASSELVAQIPNTNRHRDTNGRVNLTHAGTLTTVTLAIFGPFPA